MVYQFSLCSQYYLETREIKISLITELKLSQAHKSTALIHTNNITVEV